MGRRRYRCNDSAKELDCVSWTLVYWDVGIVLRCNSPRCPCTAAMPFFQLACRAVLHSSQTWAGPGNAKQLPPFGWVWQCHGISFTMVNFCVTECLAVLWLQIWNFQHRSWQNVGPKLQV